MSAEKTTASLQILKRLYLGILFLVFIVAYPYTFDGKLSKLGDNASYYILGKALSEGAGYVDLSKVSHSPNNHYPPGYPAIISLIMLFSNSIFVIKLVNGLFYMLSLWVLFEIITHLSHKLNFAFAVTLLILLNSHLLFYSSIMVSEIPFLLFSSLSLLAFMKVDFRAFSWKEPWLIISIVCFIISYYIRSLGIALLASYLLYFFTQRQWKPMALYTVSFIAAALPWGIRSQKLGGSSYIRQLKMADPYAPELGQAGFSHILDRFYTNFGRYISRELPGAVFPSWKPDYHSPIKSFEWVAGIFFLLVLTYGIYSLPRYRWLVAGYLLGTLGILMLWPDVWIGVRFIVPLIPFLMAGFFYGCYKLLQKGLCLINSGKRLHPLALLIFVVLYIYPAYGLHKKANVPYSPAWNSYFEIADWLRKNEQKDVIVTTGKPGLFHLRSGLYGMRYKFADDPAELIADLEKNRVDYVVIDEVHMNTRRYLIPATEKYPHRFKEVFRVKNTNTYLLRFKK